MLAGKRIAVIGLDYVDLPLAVEVGMSLPVVDFDISLARVAALGTGKESALGVTSAELAEAKQLTYSNCLEEIADYGAFIVTVPKPVARANRRIWRRWSAPLKPLAER